MSEERLPSAPRADLGEVATIKGYLIVHQEGSRHVERLKPPAPKRKKGGKA
jgi:hypothetical protein